MCKKEHEKGYNVYTLFKSVRNGEGERGRRRRKEKIKGMERKRSERKKNVFKTNNNLLNFYYKNIKYYGYIIK